MRKDRGRRFKVRSAVPVPQAVVLLTTAILLLPCFLYGQNQTQATPARPDQKGLEAVLAFSQSLSQWGFLIIAGSVGLVLGTSHSRPGSRWMRFSYLVFVPAWMLLGYSLYMGMAAQGNVLALLNLKNVNEPVTKLELNNNLSCQISYMKAGLVILGIWFAVYFSWWVITQAPNQRDSNV